MKAAMPERPAVPWYREPWPWLLMLGPAVAVVAGIATLILAIRSNDGLVADDYYKQGLAINRTMERDDEARAMRYGAELAFSRGDRKVRAILSGVGPLPAGLRLHLIHPSRSSADEAVMLRSVGTGIYEGQCRRELTGRRHLILEDQQATWRITGEWVEPNVEPVRIGFDAERKN